MSQVTKIRTAVHTGMESEAKTIEKKTKKKPNQKKSAWKIWLFILVMLGVLGGYTVLKVPATKDLFFTALGGSGSSSNNPSEVKPTLVTDVKPKPTKTDRQMPSTTLTNNAGTIIPSKETLEAGVHIAEAKDIAKVYAAMMPNKAAAILEKQSTVTIVYAMTEMSTEERSKIWSKMDPAVVADVSAQIKPRALAKDKDLAALQKKIHSEAKDTQNKSIQDLSNLYSDMPVTAAAKLIQEMMKTDSDTTIQVIKKMNEQNQSKLLTAMASNKGMVSTATKIIQALGK
ncbi:hypothetical protein [Paenibacillus sp. BIC5C1]|uniref:hypothetical protein n=1 Tax=Paenibacillus sp. BIC5C1 TaxID=3078263 RepID=UPI0028F1338E|nr:hypothetical protein [Paenibacillus sp. BIC5C1]